MNHDPSNHEELMTRWIDGELSDPEAAAFKCELEGNPKLKEELEAARGLGDLLRGELLASKEPPYPELFNSQIMKRIDSGKEELQVDYSKVVRPPGGIWSHMPWLIAAAAVLMAALLVIQQPESTRQPGSLAASETMNTYAPRDGVLVRTRFAPEAGATVLSLEGLEEVPSNHEIEGDLVASYLPAGPGEIQLFASHENDQPVYVLHTDAGNVPSVRRLSRD